MGGNGSGHREHGQPGERRLTTHRLVSGAVEAHEHGLRPQTCRHAGTDEIAALNQKGGLALTVLAYAQRGRPFDERVLPT
jgi:hypothetical protein